ncbi:SMP-30/gluconolactonase/LRE family protein [Rhizobiaceae bacterium n13]|uniref:SMP-30/gluconolactonase/LRE family protein n=1 Tax=Ferirhizobium litorale TaxID=2927786 RepID=A0AAE3QAY3_9HYPH|nr:SMP-30/gluconolactonase/LRE family protein [Fererhizobium litorale]MDI7861524.1 SMP-30/gluconolactonase/LRE family protein [Fererhizobium litorale]MDI7921670.1 SMP-30/gluconolactonase/LRE family protein [Fererhizobium litorale]
MTEVFEFRGRVLCEARLMLGEGPTYDPATDTTWWFNIKGKELHELHLTSGRKTVHPLPMMASVLARIDSARQLIASEDGLFLRDTATGALTPHAKLESDVLGNRSNDGRVHPSGALWIGTMGKHAEDGAGAIYHVAKGVVTRLFDSISIPNAICFTADGTIGYFADSKANVLKKVALDPATGLPTAKPEVFLASPPSGIEFDGAVCDADGYIWNASWNGSGVDRYAADGTHVAHYKVPARQTTCPAFIGAAADRLLVTSAWADMDDAARAADPLAGATFELGIPVKGIFDRPYIL